MLISLIIPVYNKAEYLAPLLQSVVGQTYRDLEIICVDDGSTDESPAILEAFRKKDSRIRVVRQENKGVSEARNTGLRIATGEAVAFADCDDLLPDDAIGHLASLFSPEVDAVVSSVETKYEVHSEYATSDDNYFRVKEEGTRSVSSHDLFGLHCLALAKLFRRSLIQELGLEFPRGIYYEDAFWHWCFMMNTRRVCFTKKVCYTYIRHPNSIMSLTYEKREGMAIHHLFVVEAIIGFLKKHCRNALDPKDIDELLRIYFWLAFNNSPAFEQPRAVWECSRFLRSENYDCSRSPFLQGMKNGNFYPDAEKRIEEAGKEKVLLQKEIEETGKEKALLQEKAEALGEELSRIRHEKESLRRERESLQQELGSRISEISSLAADLGRTREDAARFSKEAFAWKKKCLRPKYYRYVLLSKATIGRRRAHYRNKVLALRKEFGFR